jgi:hypothetical protein
MNGGEIEYPMTNIKCILLDIGSLRQYAGSRING